MKTIRVKRRLEYPPEMIWLALTEGQQIEKWLMPNDFRAEVGHKFQFKTKPTLGFDGIVNCEVLALEPNRLLKLSWRGGGIDTTVTFKLSALESGTELQVEQEGFELSNVIPRVILGQGWKSIIGKKLPSTLDQMTKGVG